MLEEYYLNPAINHSFNIFSIGREKCLADYQFGPHLRDDYVLHYVLEGGGIFEIGNVRYEVEAGQFFLIQPQEVTLYRANSTNPWHYFWLGFNGSESEAILAHLGLYDYQRVGFVKDQGKVMEEINQLLHGCGKTEKNTLELQGLAQIILSNFELTTQPAVNESLIRNSHIEKLLYAIQHNYSRADYSIQELADTLNLTAPYLTALTKKELGQSPSQVLRNYRLKKAKYLIQHTELLMTEIAQAVGYESPLSFSRAYKKHYQISPSQDKP